MVDGFQRGSRVTEKFFERVIVEKARAEFVGVVARCQFEQGRGDLIGRLNVDEAWIFFRKEVRHRTPVCGEDGHAKGHRFDDDEAEAFAVIECGKAEDVAFGEEFGFVGGRGEADMANCVGVAEACECLAEESFSFGVGKGASDGQRKFERQAVVAAEAIGLAEAFDGVEDTFFARAETDEKGADLDR